MEPQPSGPDGTQQAPGSSDWLFPVFLTVALVILFGITRWVAPPTHIQQSSGTTEWTPTPIPTGQTVSLTIDFGNGVKKQFSALPWRAGMTVADLLEEAAKFQPSINFSQTGKGATGFLTSLEGLANEGAGGRNWFFRVDDQHIHVSFCLEKLEPGMHVLWLFTDELYNGGSVEE